MVDATASIFCCFIGAEIFAEVDGTPASNVMPAALVFSTNSSTYFEQKMSNLFTADADELMIVDSDIGPIAMSGASTLSNIIYLTIAAVTLVTL